MRKQKLIFKGENIIITNCQVKGKDGYFDMTLKNCEIVDNGEQTCDGIETIPLEVKTIKDEIPDIIFD